jgi:hypothetical protein
MVFNTLDKIIYIRENIQISIFLQMMINSIKMRDDLRILKHYPLDLNPTTLSPQIEISVSVPHNA